MIHIEGMGILGSVLAWELHRRRISFTWNDCDATVNAWNASTGAIYPSGDAVDMRNYAIWSEWASGAAPWAESINLCIEQASYWFLSKNPPHKGKYKIAQQVGPLRMASLPSIHLDAQRFVVETRMHFASLRLAQRPQQAEKIVVAHGYDSRRLADYVWGWSAHASLKIDPQLLSDLRPSFYCRSGRFRIAYAYLRPGHGDWYAGSSLIVQKVAKPLVIDPKVTAWVAWLERVTEGLVQVESTWNEAEGWRPRAHKGDKALAKEYGNEIVMQPQWHSGIRHSPLHVRSVIEKICA